MWGMTNDTGKDRSAVDCRGTENHSNNQEYFNTCIELEKSIGRGDLFQSYEAFLGANKRLQEIHQKQSLFSRLQDIDELVKITQLFQKQLVDFQERVESTKVCDELEDCKGNQPLRLTEKCQTISDQWKLSKIHLDCLHQQFEQKKLEIWSKIGEEFKKKIPLDKHLNNISELFFHIGETWKVDRSFVEMKNKFTAQKILQDKAQEIESNRKEIKALIKRQQFPLSHEVYSRICELIGKDPLLPSSHNNVSNPFLVHHYSEFQKELETLKGWLSYLTLDLPVLERQIVVTGSGLIPNFEETLSLEEIRKSIAELEQSEENVKNLADFCVAQYLKAKTKVEDLSNCYLVALQKIDQDLKKRANNEDMIESDFIDLVLLCPEYMAWEKTLEQANDLMTKIWLQVETFCQMKIRERKGFLQKKQQLKDRLVRMQLQSNSQKMNAMRTNAYGSIQNEFRQLQTAHANYHSAVATFDERQQVENQFSELILNTRTFKIKKMLLQLQQKLTDATGNLRTDLVDRVFRLYEESNHFDNVEESLKSLEFINQDFI